MASRIVLSTVLLASCSRAPSAQDCKALAEPKAVIERCFAGKLEASANYVGDTKCWPFSKSQRMRGIWVIDLESSVFFRNARSLARATGKPMWLETDLLNRKGEMLDAAQGAGRRAYAVELQGRQALCDGSFGHMGLAGREVIAERFYSIQALPSGK